ncbi:MAG TPA: LAGLIDADG family homing endonuclease [Actinomycetota bacterium]|nr:LAGLIDADG family homing endonuclease [Actinomycetota bacterium]
MIESGRGGGSAGDKARAVELTRAQIEKQFGKGAIMKLGERVHVPMEVIPTGSLGLDVALGIGGLPRGRIVEIYGPESSGKCLTADSYVWTDHGLETVGELFGRTGNPASCTSRITDISELGVRAVNENGELETVAALTHNNRKPVRQLTLKSGRTLKVTHNHPLRVLDENGFIVWRPAGEIQAGDVMVSALFGAVEAASGDGMSEAEAVFAGYLVAEGTLGRENSVRFTNWDLEVGAEFTQLAESLFGAKVRCYDGKEYAIYSKQLRTQLFEAYGLDYVSAHGKKVPYGVRTAGHKVQRAFLSALFEGDGWIDASSTVGLGTASEQLAREVQLLLYGLGIPATVSSKFNQKYERNYWSVTINPSVVHRFLEEIGFRSARRASQVEANFRPSGRDPQFENIPGISKLVTALRNDLGGDRAFDRVAGDLFRYDMKLGCSRSRLDRIVKWAEGRSTTTATGSAILAYLKSLLKARLTFEPVVAVEDAGAEPTFDLVLPETHSFIANGVLSHNTSLCLHVIAEAQKLGGIAAFVDAEHALDIVYARNLGVNVDELLVSQPDTGEQALEITDMLVRSGAIDVIVVDSVAALVPKAEIEGEMGDSHIGLQARLMSQALRKLAGNVSRSNTLIVFINQLREKVGVMFGCFSYDTRITLADGTQEKIGKIVNQKLPVEVLSYDPAAGAVVPKKVVNWFDNGVTEQFLNFSVARPGGNGRAQFSCTDNHKIRTPAGWREAGELVVGDRVLEATPHYLSDFQWEVILGGLMGGGALSSSNRGLGARYRFGQGVEQQEYCDWKASLLGNIGSSRSTNAKGQVFYDFQPLAELAELRKAVYVGGKKVLSHDFLKNLTALSIAIWYLDDGSFAGDSRPVESEISVQAMEPASRERLVEYLGDTWNLHPNLIERAGKAVLSFPRFETGKLHALVAPYVHPSMQHKLLPRFRGQFNVTPQFAERRYELMPFSITSIGIKPKTRSMHRFDIEVEGSHNYLADGVVVHNSPEVTSGGRALKFYSSVRLDIRKIENLKNGQEVVGSRVRVKVVKSKVSAPFRQTEFDIQYGHGISKEGSLLDTALDLGICSKSGSWYLYDGDQIGQGRENTKAFLSEHTDVFGEIEHRVKVQMGLIPDPSAPKDPEGTPSPNGTAGRLK